MVIEAEPMVEVRENILGEDYRFEPAEIWDTVSELGKDFIRTVLVTDPVARPNVSLCFVLFYLLL